MPFQRSIKVAFDKTSGEILEADDVFDTAKNSFELRRQYHRDEVELYCCECDQKLNVSSSKYDRLHFKHPPNASFCYLKEANLSQEETDQMAQLYRGKESARHKTLKNKIAEKLSNIGGVHSICVDDTFIYDENEKRRPDVYCKYLDKELVFEIQLSDLSLRYIYDRHDFYQRKGIFLIWILDDFDVHGQRQMERDIKYLTDFQNFFKLDEDSEPFRLLCTYKYPFLTDDNKLLSKWKEKSVSLQQLKFSIESCQVYYFDYGGKLKVKEKEHAKLLQKERQEEVKMQEHRRKVMAEEKAISIIDDLRFLWQSKGYNFSSIEEDMENLDEFELSVLNESDAFKLKDGQPRIHHWFSIAKKDHMGFLEHMIDSSYLEIDLNEKSKDNNTLLATMFENKAIEHKMWLLRRLIRKGYTLKKEDETILAQIETDPIEYESTLIIFRLANMLNGSYIIDELFEHKPLVCIIESAKRDEIIGYRYQKNQWIAFANNAIHSYTNYWSYIEKAFKNYGIWEKLMLLDKKKTFQKKLAKFHATNPKQNVDCIPLLNALYPELKKEESQW